MFSIKIKPCAKKLTYKNYLIVEMFSIKIEPCSKKLMYKNYLMLSRVNP